MNKESSYKPLEEIILKYLSGKATAEERDKILAWIKADNSNKKYFEEIQKQHLAHQLTSKSTVFNREGGWNRVRAAYYKEQLQNQNLETRQKTRRLLSFASVAVAASLLIAFFIGKWVYSPAADAIGIAQEFNEIHVPHGARTQLTLSDGTKVWLNAGSTFRYPSRFLTNSREVTLEGEAFFDVTHVANKIFVVKTAGLNIKVFGTRFNVKSYPGEQKITTTLVKGSIAIETKNSKADPLLVKPNQIVTYFEDTKAFKIEEAELKQKFAELKSIPDQQMLVIPETNLLTQTSWKDSKWVIDAKELGELAVLLERRYNVKINFDNEELKKYRFSGTLADETFEQVLKVVQISAPITYSIHNNLVTFYEDSAYRKKYDKMIGN
jgi:ferric-dicitrate binding protein FerR (iron transport regulator)